MNPRLTSAASSEFSNKDLSSVGNYTLGRLIGKGSFGKVYLASHKLTNGSKVGNGRHACWDNTLEPGLVILINWGIGRPQIRK